MLNLTQLYQLVDDGLLRVQHHNELPLSIWNYTDKVHYENLWDETLLQCRGLITHTSGKIIARPFAKFFNIEEQKHVPTNKYEIFEKLDGSLLILTQYNNQLVLATRGSFHSDQANKAYEIFRKNNYDLLNWNNEYTYLFELIYPENKIVVNYGKKEDVVLLGVINTKSGEEIKYEDLNKYSFSKIKVVDRLENTDYNKLRDQDHNGKEGFVVKFSNGHRIKLKFEEYVKLHKIITNLSTTVIWESLKEGVDIYEYIKDLPDEFYHLVNNYRYQLLRQYEEIEKRCKLICNYANEKYKTRKEFAGYVVMASKHSSVIFAMLDNKDYSNIIWKILKPKYAKL